MFTILVKTLYDELKRIFLYNCHFFSNKIIPAYFHDSSISFLVQCIRKHSSPSNLKETPSYLCNSKLILFSPQDFLLLLSNKAFLTSSNVIRFTVLLAHCLVHFLLVLIFVIPQLFVMSYPPATLIMSSLMLSLSIIFF